MNCFFYLEIVWECNLYLDCEQFELNKSYFFLVEIFYQFIFMKFVYVENLEIC